MYEIRYGPAGLERSQRHRCFSKPCRRKRFGMRVARRGNRDLETLTGQDQVVRMAHSLQGH